MTDYKYIGKSAVRVDGKAKISGAAPYIDDIEFGPGLLYAAVVESPHAYAKIRKIDVSKALKVEGVVKIVTGEDFPYRFGLYMHDRYVFAQGHARFVGEQVAAVIARTPAIAKKAAKLVKVDYQVLKPVLDVETALAKNAPLIHPELGKYSHVPWFFPENKTNIAHIRKVRKGESEKGFKEADHIFEDTYTVPRYAHCSIETHGAVGLFDNSRRLTVWAASQSPFTQRHLFAEALAPLGISHKDVRVIAPFVGGGFGGKTFNLQAVEAARLAKATGKPVQVMWSREEEFYHDTFRPAAVVKINAGVDADGKMTYWDYDVYFAGDRGAPQFYTVPNHRTASHGSGFGGPQNAHPFGTGAWRAPGNNTNTFARESHIDDLAAAARMDPVEFRLKNLSNPRMIRVLKAAADKFGWTPAKLPSKRGYGVACGIDADTLVASIAEVAVDPKDGSVQVKRVVCAQDMGIVINPEGARIQMEGCIMMGLGYCLTEEVHFDSGKVLDTNFDSYEIPRYLWLPKIETVIIDNKEDPPAGGGEPAITVMGAIVANAIHDATGARLLQLPMTPERVKAALQKV